MNNKIMYFEKLSLETLNESNQWNMLDESDYPEGGYAMNYAPMLSNGSATISGLTNKLSSIGQKISNAYSVAKQNAADAQKFGAAYKFIHPGSAADNFNPDISTSVLENPSSSWVNDTATSNISGTFSDLWTKFINKISSWYDNAKTETEQFAANHQQGIDRATGFGAGVAAKTTFDYLMKWLFPPEVQEKAQNPEQMSALASAGISAAATAGVLGLIWLFKKWKNKGQITDQDMRYAAQLNQMKSQDIPEEDKNKPIQA